MLHWVLMLPGIPGHVAEFETSFRAGLYSGVFSGVFTGIMVGIVVWIIQRLFERRHVQRLTDKEVSVFIERLRYALATPDVINLSSAEEAAPPAAIESITLILGSPVDIWVDVSQRHRSLLLSVIHLRKLHLTFVSSAKKLDWRLDQLIRQYCLTKGLMQRGIDHSVKALFLSMMGDPNGNEASKWIGNSTLSLVKDSYEWLRNDDELVNFSEEYAHARNNLVQGMAELHQSIDLHVK